MNTHRTLTSGLKLALLIAPTGALLPGCGDGAPPPEPSLATQSRPLTYNGHDYLFIRSAKTWAQADLLCTSLGYGLVSINDAQEEAFLHGFMGTVGWSIGLNSQKTPGVWVWRDGTSPSAYTHWASGEPNNYYGSEYCVYDSSAGWADVPCTSVSTPYVICESLN